MAKRYGGHGARDSSIVTFSSRGSLTLLPDPKPTMPSNPSANRLPVSRPEIADPFAMQLALSRVHARLVPMRRAESGGYEIDPSALSWFELPSGRGFAGYGLGRALRMLLDVLRGLTALHDTFTATGNGFAHGEVALPQFRVDNEGVCRLVPLTARHFSGAAYAPEALGHVAPERLLGEGVDARSDVFSAGVLLWEALAGRRLFSEATGEAIIDRLMGEKLQMPQLPPELAWAIPLKSVAARALSVDPYQRFADCAELSTAITIIARERVASHTEIANFFGSTSRSGSSVTPAVFQRPVPSQSSTFPAVDAPFKAGQRTSHSTLAPLGARSVTPAPASIRPSPFVTLLAPTKNEPEVDFEEVSEDEIESVVIAARTHEALEALDTVPNASEPPPESYRPVWSEEPSELAPPPPASAMATEEMPRFRGRSRGMWLLLALALFGAGVAVLTLSAVEAPSAAPVASDATLPAREGAAAIRHDRPGIPLTEVAPTASPDAKPMRDAAVPRGTATSKPRAPAKSDGRDYGI